MDPAVRRAISKVVQRGGGGLRVVMHDKLAALDKLARALGMYQDDTDPKSPAQPLVATVITKVRPRSHPPTPKLVGASRTETTESL